MVAKVKASTQDSETSEEGESEGGSEGGGSEGGGSEGGGYEGSGSSKGSDSSEGVATPKESPFDGIKNLIQNGVPFAGGNITPAKIGRGYGAKWTMNFSKGGEVSKASKRADGIAQRGKTKGRYL